MRRIAELMNLSGRRAFVTGAAGHLGVSICETLLELGARVAVVDQHVQPCRQRTQWLNARWGPGAAQAVPCDVSDERAARRAIRHTAESLGGLDILVHAAAYVNTSSMDGWAVPFECQTVKAWDRALRVNLTAALVMAQEARKLLAASRHGSVIFIGSIYGVAGPDFRLYYGTRMANPAGYGASKGGLMQLTRYLATLFAPAVRVNAISPGGVARGQPRAFQQRYAARTPLKRMAVEEDVAGAVAYLASDLSSYVTGQNLMVDGGWTAW